MPPKRKQGAKENDESSSKSQKSEDAALDPFCTTKLGKARAYTENDVVWEAMLLTADNKYFYLLQLVEDLDYVPSAPIFSSQSHSVWTRWGKVGGKSVSKLHNLVTLSSAKACFEERFFEKTDNVWNDKHNFKPSGRYNLCKMNFNIGKPILKVNVPKVSVKDDVIQLPNATKENDENKSKQQNKTKAAETITKRPASLRQPTKVKDESTTATNVAETRTTRQKSKIKEEELDELMTATTSGDKALKKRQTATQVAESSNKLQKTKIKDEEEIVDLKATTTNGNKSLKRRGNTTKVADSPTKRQKTKIKDEEEIVDLKATTTNGNKPLKKRGNTTKVADSPTKLQKKKIKEEEETVELKTVTTCGDKSPVDSFCTSKIGLAHVYVENDVIWNVMLNQTNIQFNNNKFYLIQLLEDKNCKSYNTWMRWGRVGTTGQSKLTSFGHLDPAKTFFKSKFFDKTKNDWDFKNEFVKYAGKYDLIHMDFDLSKATPEVDVPKVAVKIKDSQLDQRLQDLMKLICNIQTMEETVLEMKYDSKKAPLGKLTEEQVKAGYAALKEIELLIETKTQQQNLFVEHSNRFYTRIPHNFGMKAPPVINTIVQVLEKMQLLQVLSDIEVAMKILNMNMNGDILDNPVDRQYKCLRCDINAMDKADEMYKTIENYLLISHGKTHNTFKMKVLNIFNCDRVGEKDQFKNLSNRMLLWHGSRLTNVASILSQGLRIAPPEAPVSGYMFGKGVYFADRSSKSANYCFASRSSNVGILLLCEVALGNANELKDAKYDADKLPKGYNSVKGLGSITPDPSQVKILDDGTVIPIGIGTSPKDSSGLGLIYNEYIVYDTKQIKLKYAVQVEFNFK